LSLVDMIEPRYLKLWVNWTCWSFGRRMFGGNIFSVVSSLASFRELGKYMASVLDLVLLLPICIRIPKRWKCRTRIGVRVSRSSLLSTMNTLSSTKNTLLKSKGLPLEEVGCPIRRPLSALRFPFFGDLKKRNSDTLTFASRVSRKACIT
jgi:hypothetical protein